MYSDLKQLADYRELLRTLVSKDIRSRYKGSVLGFAWNFLANSVMGGSVSIVGNANLVKKIYFPLQILPTTTVISQFISLLLGMVVLAVVILVFGVGLSWMLLLLPLVFLIQVIFAGALAFHNLEQTETYDHHDRKYRFKVMNGPEIDIGLCYIPHSWRGWHPGEG